MGEYLQAGRDTIIKVMELFTNYKIQDSSNKRILGGSRLLSTHCNNLMSNIVATAVVYYF